MSLFNKKKRDIPNLNTAALPDLIFTVLFFFMIVTQLRDTEVKVQHTAPKAIEQTKLGKKTAKVHIYVGRHSDNPAEMSIQLGNRMGTIADIAPFIEAERSDMAPEDKDMLTVYMHADKDTPMEMINGIKNELRRLHVLRIFYNTDAAKQ